MNSPAHSEPDAPHLEVWRGDITRLAFDAIVNAANESLLGGGGVDGAIHRAAGPQLLASCRRIGGLATGDAVATPGFELPARHVIHTVGPVWHSAQASDAACPEDRALASCYARCLQVATELGVRSLAFPAISTGVYGFPAQRACQVALRTVRARALDPTLKRVVFVAFDEPTHALYAEQGLTTASDLP